MKNSKIPNVTFEQIDPADLASALASLRSVRSLNRKLVVQPKLGAGYETFLRWALSDIQEAGTRASGDDCERASVNAVMSARRALSCLVDQYLQRDGFLFCQGAPSEADRKAEILIRRQVFDSLGSQSLKRAIERRNDVEHDYNTIDLAQAQDLVHLVRATIENAVARSSPYDSPALFGSILGGYSSSGTKVQGWFEGWSGSAFLIVTTVASPWAGIIVPSNATQATVRRVDLGKVSVTQWLEALNIAESVLTDQASGKCAADSCSPNLWHTHLRAAGLPV